MPIRASNVGRYQVLSIAGDVRGDEDNHHALRRMALEGLERSPWLAVNLRHATFVDSQTLGLFVELLRAAQSRGGEVALVELNDRARKWFSLSGLDQLFKILPTEAELAGGGPEPSASRNASAALEKVNVDRMVAELEAALGSASADGAPSAVGPIDEKALVEIEKLLAGG